MLSATCGWVLSICSPSARRRPSSSASMRSNSIAIWPPRIPASGEPTPYLEDIGRIGHQPALPNGGAEPVDRRHAIFGGESGDARNERFGHDVVGHDEAVEIRTRYRAEARLEVITPQIQLRQRDAEARRGFVEPKLFRLHRAGVPSQEGDATELWDRRLQKLEPLRAEFGRKQRQARDIAARSREPRREADADEIRRDANNGNFGRLSMGADQGVVPRHQHVDAERQNFRDQRWRSLEVSLRVALLQKKVSPQHKSAFREPLA